MKPTKSIITVDAVEGRGFDITVQMPHLSTYYTLYHPSKSEGIKRAVEYIKFSAENYDTPEMAEYTLVDLTDFDADMMGAEPVPSAIIDKDITPEDEPVKDKSNASSDDSVDRINSSADSSSAVITVLDVRRTDSGVEIEVENTSDDSVVIWRKVGDRDGTKTLKPGTEELSYKADEDDKVEIRLESEDGEVLYSEN